jgi:hypothetical protein
MSLDIVLKLSAMLVSIAVFLQCTELLILRPYWIRSGIWSWDTLKLEYSNLGQKFFTVIFNEAGFFSVLMLGAMSSLLLLFTSNHLVLPLMFMTCLLIAKRFRGTFNGGSDYMTVLVLGVCSVTVLFPKFKSLAFSYLAVQALLSYFISGLSKIKNKSWRNGTALTRLLTTSSYSVPLSLQAMSKNQKTLAVGSWGVIVLELLSPLVLVHPKVCIAFMIVALCFHLINFYTLGLNRFVFAWAASYPALYWLAVYLQG